MDKETARILLTENALQHWKRYCTLIPKVNGLTFPKVEVNGRTYRTAGSSWGIDDNRVEFSLQLFIPNQGEFYKVIVPHELAHIITDKLFPERMHHGKNWRWVMVKYGLPPNPYHSMENPRK